MTIMVECLNRLIVCKEKTYPSKQGLNAVLEVLLHGKFPCTAISNDFRIFFDIFYTWKSVKEIVSSFCLASAYEFANQHSKQPTTTEKPTFGSFESLDL